MSSQPMRIEMVSNMYNNKNDDDDDTDKDTRINITLWLA